MQRLWVLLSYQLWQSQFGGENTVLGRTITLDGRGFTIIGVLPPDFRSTDKTDVMEPIGFWLANRPDASSERGERGDMIVIARLAPRVSIAQARAEMDGIAARLEQTYPRPTISSASFSGQFARYYRPAILIPFGALQSIE